MTTKPSEKAMRVVWREGVIWHSRDCIRGPDDECLCNFNQRAFNLGLAIDALVRAEVERAERGPKQVEGESQCSECEGWGAYRCEHCYSLLDRKCIFCHGTGKEPKQ